VPVLAADPDPLALAALSATLSSNRSIGPVVETQTPVEAVAAASTGQFQVAIVSEWFPGRRGGVELARELHRNQPTLLIIMVAIPTRSHEVLLAIRAGVRGYLLKQRDMRRLPQIVRHAVDHGTGEFSSPLTDELLAELIIHEPRFAPRPLTARELEVVELVAGGLSNREIADQLEVSVATVKTHVHSAMRKTSVANRVQLARRGDDLGENA
jgi:DNA-binding NarL/FixJ family response regulator